MLRELNVNEMEMVSGGEKDEVVVTGTRQTQSDGYAVTREELIGMIGGSGLSHGGMGVNGHLGGGSSIGSSAAAADEAERQEQERRDTCERGKKGKELGDDILEFGIAAGNFPGSGAAGGVVLGWSAVGGGMIYGAGAWGIARNCD